MKKNKISPYILPVTLLGTLLFSACNEDFLDRKPQNSIEASATWSDEGLSKAFVYDIYEGLQSGILEDNLLASVSDETVYKFNSAGVNAVNTGSITPANPGLVYASWGWDQMYKRIRACNTALTNFNSGTLSNKALANTLSGECHFLRAWFYHQMLRYYGGVPIVTKIYGLNDSYEVSRNTFEECVNYIVADCDSAITLLKGQPLNKGRASDLAAMMLKSRVLLYAASDLYDIPTAKSKSQLIASYANPQFLGFVSGDRTARWTRARDAAKAVLDATSGYKTNLTAPVSQAEGKANYISLSTSGASKAAGIDVSANSEMIFGRFKQAESLPAGGWASSYYYYNLFNGPNGYRNWSANTPVGQLVDDYQMMDGSPFDWNDPSKSKAPYQNREARFYASILFDGADWKPRAADDPYSQTQYGSYDLIINGTQTTFHGLDTKNSTIEDWNSSPTGYNMRRFLDPDPAVSGQVYQFIPAIQFRYTEAMFNYAEACNELGQDAPAIDMINRIRFRVGLPALPASSTGPILKEAIRHEKRIEMAFEEQRYFDVRRWMTAPTVLNSRARYIQIQGKFKPGKSLKAKYKYDPEVYDYSYTPLVSTEDIADRIWNDKLYFRPIHRDEINKNPKLKGFNNPGYE